MLDFDLAELYEVETRVFNQAVKRNIDSFPKDFMFRLTSAEWANSSSSQFVMTDKNNSDLTSQNVISSWGGRRKLALQKDGLTGLFKQLKERFGFKK